METPPVKIGQEQFFTELISDLVLPEIRQKLEGFNIQSILDIGCGQGNTLIMMYYLLGCNHLRGVDAHPEWYALELANKHIKNFNEENALPPVVFASIQDYWLHFKPNPITDKGKAILDKAWFNDHMFIRYGMNVVKWRPHQGTYYDAIISSQVFHFLKRAELVHVFNLIRQHARRGAMIYYSMKTDYKGQTTSDMTDPERLELCHQYAELFGLRYTKGEPRPKGDGDCHTWTNLME